MTKEWIEGKIKESHENAIEKGFYDCPECGGDGFVDCCHLGCYGDDSCDCENKNPECEYCKGSKLDHNKNIGELLMLIVSELGEALEAHRLNKFSDRLRYDAVLTEPSVSKKQAFEMYFKDTFEDEIADVFIRLFNLCGYTNEDLTEITDSDKLTMIPENVGEFFIQAITTLIHGFRNSFFHIMWSFCEGKNIPIKKHIEAKMAYNKTRPRKHGKAY